MTTFNIAYFAVSAETALEAINIFWTTLRIKLKMKYELSNTGSCNARNVIIQHTPYKSVEGLRPTLDKIKHNGQTHQKLVTSILHNN